MTDRMHPAPNGWNETPTDTYAWLNQPGTDVETWIDTENARSRAHIESIEGFAQIHDELVEILGAEHRSLPKVAGGRSFQLRRGPGEEQHSLWVSDEAGDRVLVAASELATATDSIATFSPTPDGTKVVWTASTGGADWQLARIRDVASGRDLSDELTGMKWPDLAWLDDESFAYMSWAIPVAGEELTALNSGATIRVHTIGTDQATDPVIYEPSETTWVIPTASADGKWLLLEQMKGIVPATIFRKPLPLREADAWETVLDEEGPDSLVGVHEGSTLVLSYRGHSAGRFLAIGASDPAAAGAAASPERVLYESPDSEPLSDAFQLGDHGVVVAHTLEGSRITVFALADGSVTQRETLPAGYVLQSIRAVNDTALAVDIEVIGGEREVAIVALSDLSELSAGTAAPLLVETHWVTSADGTRVPMRVVRQHGAVPERSARVFLSVYGGYAVPFLTNGFSSWQLAWVRSGGVLAYAGVRGGGELGEAWHQAARRERKQQGIEDLIACAEWFEASGWSAPHSVAINGMSNGGLMTAAALVQRPELFGAVVTEVPVADMLNFHRYTAAHGWIAEYGDPDVPADREFLAAYSPLHNVHADRQYAPTLVLTADMDDRVPPGPHAYPLAAALRETRDGDTRTYLSVTRNAGHATGRSFNDTVAERSAVLAFAAWGIAHTSTTPHHGNGAA
ncbi:Prolyl endopeptidase [Leucobacter sp. BZR 635]